MILHLVNKIYFIVLSSNRNLRSEGLGVEVERCLNSNDKFSILLNLKLKY